MQLVNKKLLEEIINEAKAEGKDTSQLEETLSQRRDERKMRMGEIRKSGKWMIVSTGPAQEEDFEEI